MGPCPFLLMHQYPIGVEAFVIFLVTVHPIVVVLVAALTVGYFLFLATVGTATIARWIR